MNKKSSEILQDLKKKRERIIKTTVYLVLLSILNFSIFLINPNLVSLFILALLAFLLLAAAGKITNISSILSLASILSNKQ